MYEKGIEYWDGIDASLDGVLGGFGSGVSATFFLELVWGSMRSKDGTRKYKLFKRLQRNEERPQEGV